MVKVLDTASGSGRSVPNADDLSSVVDVMASFVETFEPGRYSGEDAESLVALFTRVERLGSAGKTLAAHRAAEAHRHTVSGHRTPAEWLATETGESVGDALSTLQLAERLADQPGVDEALRAGVLSSQRAKMVAEAVSDNPARTKDLIRGARTDSQRQFKERCLRARAEGRSAEDEAAHARRLHQHRSCRTFTTTEGAFGLRAVLPPETGASVGAALRAEADRFFKRARQSGEPESPDRYAADALVALLTGQEILPPHRRGRERGEGAGGRQVSGEGAPAGPANGTVDPATDEDPVATPLGPTDTAVGLDRPAHSSSRPDPRTWVLIRADLEALRRGSAGAGEICEIPGVGPVPVDHARAVLGDALCHLVITNGVDVTTVCSLGRHIPEALRVAILERDRTCRVPGCHRDLGLEHDHWQVDYAKGGATSLENIALLCRHHHQLKTHQGWRLVRHNGEWQFLPPESPKPRQASTTTRRRRPPPGTTTPGPSLFQLEE
jgi:hypothetical protein